VARWPRRRKSEKLVALIVLEKRQKQPSTFLQTKKKALLSQDLFLCVGAEGDPIFIYRVWHTAGLVRSGYRRGYKKRYAGPTLNLNESERERLWCDLSVTRCETMLTLNEVMDWLCSSQRNVLL